MGAQLPGLLRIKGGGLLGLLRRCSQAEGSLDDEGWGAPVCEARANANYTNNCINAGSPDVASIKTYFCRQEITSMGALGVDSCSFSVPCPCMIPFGVTRTPISQEGIGHHKDVIKTVPEDSTKPVVTLYQMAEEHAKAETSPFIIT